MCRIGKILIASCQLDMVEYRQYNERRKSNEMQKRTYER